MRAQRLDPACGARDVVAQCLERRFVLQQAELDARGSKRRPRRAIGSGRLVQIGEAGAKLGSRDAIVDLEKRVTGVYGHPGFHQKCLHDSGLRRADGAVYTAVPKERRPGGVESNRDDQP